VLKGFKETLVLKEHRVSKAIPGLREHKGSRVRKEHKAHKVSRASKETRASTLSLRLQHPSSFRLSVLV
jgi:hypothetical protein